MFARRSSIFGTPMNMKSDSIKMNVGCSSCPLAFSLTPSDRHDRRIVMASQMDFVLLSRRRSRASCSRKSHRQVAQRFGAYVCIFLGTQTFIPMAEAWNPIPPPTQLSPSGRGTAWSYSVPSMNSLRTFSQRDIMRSGLPEQAFDSRSRVVGVVGRALSRGGHRRPSIPRLMSMAEEESGTESPGYNPALSVLAIAGLGAIILGLRGHSFDVHPASFGTLLETAKESPNAVIGSIQGFLKSSIAKVEELGPLGPLYFGALYVMAEVLIIPAIPLTTTAGFLFGVPGGTAIVLISATVAAVISFQLGRTLLRKQVEGLLEENPKFRAVDKAIGKEGFKIILLLRLSPIFPFALSNYLYGVTSVDFFEFVGGTLLGFFPGTLVYVYGGMVGKGIMDGGGMTLPWYGDLAIVAIVAFLVKTVGDVAKNAIEEMEPGFREE